MWRGVYYASGMNSILESRHHKLTLSQKQTESALKETMWYTQDGHVSIHAPSDQSFNKFLQDEKLKCFLR